MWWPRQCVRRSKRSLSFPETAPCFPSPDTCRRNTCRCCSTAEACRWPRRIMDTWQDSREQSWRNRRFCNRVATWIAPTAPIEVDIMFASIHCARRGLVCEISLRHELQQTDGFVQGNHVAVFEIKVAQVGIVCGSISIPAGLANYQQAKIGL